MKRTTLILLALAAAVALPLSQSDRLRAEGASAHLAAAREQPARADAEKLDLATIGRIRDEGFNRSQVMDHIFWLTDVYGPRLTGSPAIQQASEWAIKKFNEW